MKALLLICLKEILTYGMFFVFIFWIYRIIKQYTSKIEDKIQKLPLKEEDFIIIEYSREMKLLMTGFFALFYSIFLICLGDLLWGWEIWTNIDWIVCIGFGIFAFGLGLPCFLGTNVWKIELKANEVVYRNYIGMKRKYTWRSITKIKKKKSGTIIAYAGKNRIFTIDDNIMSGILFEAVCKEKGIRIE